MGDTLAGERGRRDRSDGERVAGKGTRERRRQRIGPVWTRKESVPAKGIHPLERSEVGVVRASKESQPERGHSHVREGGGLVMSGRGKQTSRRGALTRCTSKESESAKGAHTLKRAEVRTCNRVQWHLVQDHRHCCCYQGVDM